VSLTHFASFLRCETQYQKYFQICRDCHGRPQFLKAETLYSYEHGSPYKIAADTHDKLLAEVNDEDFVCYELPDRVRCDRLNEFLTEQTPNLHSPAGRQALNSFLGPTVPDADKLVDELADFLRIEPRLPAREKHFTNVEPIALSVDQGREEIIAYLQSVRESNPTADLAFYAFRDMGTCDWRPFVKAAVERNPVSLAMTEAMSVEQTHAWLGDMESTSIYDGNRLAQPDEVANCKRGDGLEKAFLLANVIRHRETGQRVTLTADGTRVRVHGGQKFEFASAKSLQGQVNIAADGAITVASASPQTKA
jgi:hypothetical protein